MLPVRVIVNTPGERIDASGCDATTVTVGSGAAELVTVIQRLVLLFCPLPPFTVSVAVKLPALL